MEIQWGIHYYLVNGALLTGKIYTNRYNMALEPSDWSRALIRMLIYALQALKCPACIYASYINNDVIFIIVTVTHTTCWAELLWLPVREGSDHVHTWCKLRLYVVLTFWLIQENGTCITAWDGLYFARRWIRTTDPCLSWTVFYLLRYPDLSAL